MTDPLSARLLQSVPAPLRGVVVLDVYYERPDPETRRNTGARTEAGTLLNQAKYAARDTQTAEQAFATLSLSMADAARRLCPSPSAIIAVPSSDARFSERLGADIARGLGVKCVVPSEHGRPRVSAKEGGRRRPRFVLSEDLADVVLIVDDVYFTGATMVEVALAAQRAGAADCWGLAAARRR